MVVSIENAEHYIWGEISDGWHLLNTIIGLSVVYIATVLPFTIWTLRGFVNGIPVELEEAAMIDGLSRAQAFWRITFPLLAPVMTTTFPSMLLLIVIFLLRQMLFPKPNSVA